MHYNNKLDENILKTLIQRKHTPPLIQIEIKPIMYYDKFETSNWAININSSPSSCKKKKSYLSIQMSLRKFYLKKYIHVNFISTTPSKQLTLHVSDASSIAKHMKKRSKNSFWKHNNIRAIE